MSEPRSDLESTAALAILSELPTGLLVADEHGTVTYANTAASQLLESPVQSIVGQPLPGPLHPGIYDLETGKGPGWVQLRVSRIRADERNLFVATLHDMAESRRLKREILERTTSLEKTKADLESFIHTASHDLRAPVRAMNGLATILLEDHAAQLNADARDLLNRIVEAGNRMNGMLDGLLSLSRVDRHSLKPETLDLSALAREVVDTLLLQDSDPQTQVTIAPGLTATADRKLARVLLENLLDNAWKFTRGQPEAYISFTSGPKGSFCIEDNGIGFDEGDEVYEPFQRGGGSRPGSGLGLSTVRKVVKRHGGRIWHESRYGQGARFCFTLAPSD